MNGNKFRINMKSPFSLSMYTFQDFGAMRPLIRIPFIFFNLFLSSDDLVRLAI